MNENLTQNFGVQRQSASGEMAITAMAAKAKALVEAKYIIAMNRPRNLDQARIDILSACKRPEFAEEARYKKSVGNKLIDGRWVPQFATGFSIRFAEHAIQCMRNISTETMTIYDGDDKRTVHISVTDLESNTSYGEDSTLSKTVERRKLKEGQDAISQRQNSRGEITYLVESTEDELSNKVAAAKSKIIRNNGLRLIPSDILAEAEVIVEETLTKGGVDVKAGIKKITDAFASLNIGPTELDKYLGHSLSTVSPKELADLRAIYTTIKENAASWSDYVTAEKETQKKPDLGSRPPGDDKKPEGEKRGPGRPKKEPSPEEAAVANKTSVDAAPSSDQPQPETPQTILANYCRDAGVSWEDLRGFMVSEGIDRNADAAGIIHDLAGDMCRKLMADAKAMSKLVKLYGGGKETVTP